MGKEDEIQLIAYTIWETEGCLDGHDCEHWFRAEILWEQQHNPGITAESNKTVSKPAVKQQAKIVPARLKSNRK